MTPRATLPRWPRWLLALALRGERREVVIGDLNEEFHARIARGGSVREARRHYGQQAVASVLAMSRADASAAMNTDDDVPSQRWRPFGDLSGDVRAAFRAWRRAPVLVATVILTVACGLGLASAIFAFADGFLFRPLPYPNPDQLYVVRASDTRAGFIKTSTVEAVRASPLWYLGFTDGTRGANVSSGFLRVNGRDIRFDVDGVGEDLGQVLGVPLVAGRLFTRADHVVTDDVPVWLTHRFWIREFGGDLTVVGRAYPVQQGERLVRINIVGIVDPRITTFQTDFGPFNTLPDIFAPATPRTPQAPGTGNTITRPIVRLPRALSREQAEAAIATVLQAIEPVAAGKARTVQLETLHGYYNGAGQRMATMFFVGALLALALVTVNLIHLLLARAAARAPEISTRMSLGASRWRIARLFVVESALTGTLGIGGGLVLGRWLTAVIADVMPRRGDAGANLAMVAMTFSARVVTFAMFTGIVVALFGAVWPAWRTTRRTGLPNARSQSGGGRVISSRFSKTILASEVAISTVVLVGTVFVGIGVWRFVHQPVGLDFTDRHGVMLELPAGTSAAAINWPGFLEAVRATPGVRAAAISRAEQVRMPMFAGNVEIPQESGQAASVTTDYFEARGIGLVAGRSFTAADVALKAPVIVVDQKLAEHAWPGENPLNKDLRLGNEAPRTVIGVVSHTRSLTRDFPGMAWLPRAPSAGREGIRVWAPGLSATALATRLVGPAQATAPGSIARVQALSFESTFADDLTEVRVQRPIIIFLGAFAFLLAGVGLFGLVAYVVEQRRRDFGIRLALGAQPTDIWRHVVGQSLVPAVAGIAAGVLASWLLQNLARATVLGWQSSGWWTMAIVSVAMLMVAALAAAGPARRVLRIDPTIALRAE